MSLFAAQFSVALHDIIRVISEMGRHVIILSAKSEDISKNQLFLFHLIPSYSILFHLTTSYSSYFGGKKGISRNKTSFFLLMYADDIACSTPSCLHSSLKNDDVNQVSLSVITFLGIPMKGNTCSLKSAATPSASIVSLHGKRITALVQSWSVIVRIESYPFDSGNLTMKSIAMV